MAITRIWRQPTVVTLTLAVASVRGHRPVVGFAEEVEKVWEQLRRKYRVKMATIVPRSVPLTKAASADRLDAGAFGCDVTILDGLAFRLPPPPPPPPLPDRNPKPPLDCSQKPQKSSTCSDIGSVFSKFRQLEASEREDRKDDVYNKNYVPKKYSKMSAEYGTPKPGTLTEMRAKKASKHIAKEMVQICEVITEYGQVDAKTGKVEITFGELFHIYQFISDKVVGILLRARKHNMIAFEGEMLFQRRDEAKVISLLLTPEEVRNAVANL